MMINYVFSRFKEKSYVLQGIAIFLIFLLLYTMLDYLNGGYKLMINDFSIFLVIINIILNIIMSFISMIMMNASSIYMSVSSREGKGSIFTGVSVLFGMLTYGCTPCLIAFFATIGITFSVALLPLAGLPYKLISLLILIIGFTWLMFEIKKSRCKININGKNNY